LRIIVKADQPGVQSKTLFSEFFVAWSELANQSSSDSNRTWLWIQGDRSRVARRPILRAAL